MELILALNGIALSIMFPRTMVTVWLVLASIVFFAF